MIDLEGLRKTEVAMFRSGPLVASPVSLISEIVGIFEKSDVYEVFIEDGDKVGVVSIRDVLRATDIRNMRASSLMTTIPKLLPTDAVARAAALMGEYRLRSFPLGEKRIDGAVTVQSLCQALLPIREFGSIRIDKLVKKDPLTIGKNDYASKARSLMVKDGLDQLPVLDSGNVCGMLLSNQVVLSMFPKEKVEQSIMGGGVDRYSDIKVTDLMDANVLVCDPEEYASDVLKRMLIQHKTNVVVKLWDELQGIVTYRDFVGLLVEPEKPDFPAYIVGLPDDPFEAHLARAKFFREARALRRSFLGIEEISATIKTKNVPSGSRRYEVSVSIKVHGAVHAYSAGGWDLALVFDGLQGKMKRLLTQKPDRRMKETARRSSLAS